MISLEKVRQLADRVTKAVEVIKILRSQNDELTNQVTRLETDLEKLRNEVLERNSEEEQLEVSFQGVIDILDEVEQTATVIIEPSVESDESISTFSIEEPAMNEPPGNDMVDDSNDDSQPEFDIF